MRVMSRRSCFRTLLYLLATSSFIAFTFLLRCHGNVGPEDDAEAELLIAARGAVGVSNTVIDIVSNSDDGVVAAPPRPEEVPSRRHIAELREETPAAAPAPAAVAQLPPLPSRKLEPYLEFNNDQASPTHQYKSIDCIINGDYTVEGRQEGSEVYLPFSFIHKYFEIQGHVVHYDGADRFEWQHSFAKVYFQEPYRSDGIFMSFHHYNVEARDRVKYFSGVEGVPLSTQWGQQGYFYPIQIAQYGLSHYSKNLTEHPPRMTLYEDAEGRDLSGWSSPGSHGELKFMQDEGFGSRVLEFKTTGENSMSSSNAWSLPLNTKSDFVIAFDLRLFANSSITIVAESEEQGRIVNLVFTTEDDGFRISKRNIIYGIGPVDSWRKITRNLQIDYKKAMVTIQSQQQQSKTKRKYVLQKLLRIELRGHGRIDNIELATTLHMYHFFDAADWLVNHQDERGGWPIMVERTLGDKMTLAPGWYSAMAQGHGMSMLVRAYIKTRRKKYLRGALRATRPFTIPSSMGGVLAKFMDKYAWYEEYPTSPGSFVLNGFIYSLVGLYDVSTVADGEEGREAKRIFDEGMLSLKALLPLFDMGSGTIYDLRHITLGKAPNLARWDYHATHISQLQLLAYIDSDPIFKDTVARWIGYTKGKRAAHN